KYHWRPAKAATSTRAITRGILRRRARATTSRHAPSVASTGLYHGVARRFSENWATNAAGPSRQAEMPAQRYARPRERWSADGVVARVVMLESLQSARGMQGECGQQSPG